MPVRRLGKSSSTRPVESPPSQPAIGQSSVNQYEGWHYMPGGINGSTAGTRVIPSVQERAGSGLTPHFLGVSVYLGMDSGLEALPDDILVLKAALVAERGERIAEAARAAHAEAEFAVARA
jgi:hypothetical protein